MSDQLENKCLFHSLILVNLQIGKVLLDGFVPRLNTIRVSLKRRYDRHAMSPILRPAIALSKADRTWTFHLRRFLSYDDKCIYIFLILPTDRKLRVLGSP